jgi:hypothetical protein
LSARLNPYLMINRGTAKGTIHVSIFRLYVSVLFKFCPGSVGTTFGRKITPVIIQLTFFTLNIRSGPAGSSFKNIRGQWCRALCGLQNRWPGLKNGEKVRFPLPLPELKYELENSRTLLFAAVFLWISIKLKEELE